MDHPVKPVYLDYHATTPVDPAVLEAMMPWFSEHFGNPASRSHSYGWQADEAVEISRQQVADLLKVGSKDIIFTSGATEGLNMAIKGLAYASEHIGKHIVTVATEHHAVLDSVDWLKKKGFEVTFLPVLPNGRLDLNQYNDALRSDTVMAAVMWANNETGVTQDMIEIGVISKNVGVPLISDATQAAGKIDLDPGSCGVDMLTISGHKLYGPKGVGVTYINPNMKIKPQAFIHGGGHERGYRSGTLNVPGIVGLGVAAALRSQNLEEDTSRIGQLRDQFEKLIMSALEEVNVNGDPMHRLSTVTNLCIKGVDSQSVMSRFRSRLAISSGSACSSADPAPSHVLLAMGRSVVEAKGSFRFSLGVPTTVEEVDFAAQTFIEAIETERRESPIWQMYKQGIDVS